MARPALLNGITVKKTTVCGNMYITINFDDAGKLREVFCNIGRAGTCARTWAEAAGRMVGEGIKKDLDIKRVIRALEGIRCYGANGDALSCPDAIAGALKTYLTLHSGGASD